MKRRILGTIAVVALLCAVTLPGAAAEEDGWTKLFNGKNLKGWKKLGGEAEFTVEDGAIVGRSVPNTENTFLCTKKLYSDFVLTFQVKLVDNALNSGVQFRSNSFPSYKGGRVHGYQMEIEANPSADTGYKPLGEAGYIYDEARRGWLSQERDEHRNAFKNNEWNDVKIRCEGSHIQTWINGQQVTDLEDDMTRTGFIGLQVHGVGDREKPLEVRWRDLKLKRLDADQWTSMFDGESLDGWYNPYEWGQVSVENEEIHLKAEDKFFLASEKTYGDFVFEAEVKLPDRHSNSGLQFRSHAEKNNVYGYQAEVDPSDRKWAGGLYDEGRRGWLNPLKGKPSAQQAFNPDEWNSYRIECRGDHIEIYVNGVRTTNYRDPLDVKGHFALQHHGEAGKLYRFRNIRVKTLGQHAWKPIFDGKSFKGWHHKPGGEWNIKDGVLVGTHAKDDSRHGVLVSDKAYGDFTVRCKFKVDKGNSGFYFRTREVDKPVGVQGFQAEVEQAGNVGGLYETGGRGWVVKPGSDLVNDAYRPDDWNRMTVSAHGKWIVVHLNGHRMSQLKGDVGRMKGHLALQLHANQNVKVRYKDIEMLKKQK
mgnify:CR=1 FL=1